MLNVAAIEAHVRSIGIIPAGINAIRKAIRDGDNVTKLEIFLGPSRLPKD